MAEILKRTKRAVFSLLFQYSRKLPAYTRRPEIYILINHKFIECCITTERFTKDDLQLRWI